MRKSGFGISLAILLGVGLSVSAWGAANPVLSDFAELNRDLDFHESRGHSPSGKPRDRLNSLLARAMKSLQQQWNASETESDSQKKEFIRQEISEQVRIIYERSAKFGIGIPFVKVLNKNKPIGPDNFVFVEVSSDLSEANRTAGNDFLKVQDQRSWVKKAAYAGFEGAKYFGVQAALFTLAQGMFSAALVGVFYKDNPLAWEEFTNSINKEGAISLGMFIAVNHPVSRMLQGIRKGAIPKSMIPYMSMGAAMLISEIGMDLYMDKDFWACAKSRADGAAGIDEYACDAASRKWVLQGKIMQYAPRLMTMMASIALSSGTSAILRGGAEVVMRAGSRYKFIFRGAYLIRKGFTAASFAGRFNPVGGAVSIGGLMIFFAWDKVIAEPFTDSLGSFTLANFDLDAWLNKRGGHYEFYNRKDFTEQPIADAFDVMGTNLVNLDRLFKRLIPRISNNLEHLLMVPDSCIPDDKKNIKLSSIYQSDYLSAGQFDRFIEVIPFYGKWSAARRKRLLRDQANALLVKTDEQLDCEVLAQPFRLIDQYHAMNSAWRTNIMGRFLRRYDQWQKVTSNFNDVYLTSMKLGEGLSKLRFDHQNKPLEKPEILSLGGMQSLMGQTPAPVFGSEEDDRAFPPTFYDVSTQHVEEYVIAGFACGVQPGDTVGNYLGLPFGSPIEFHPPKLVSGGNGSICRVFGSGRAPRPPPRRPEANPWKENGKTYKSLYHYVYENLDPAIWKGDRFNGFASWWVKNISNPIRGVWTGYETDFDSLVEKELRPVLFDRSYRFGCDGLAQPGSSPLEADYHPDNYINEEGYVAETEDESTIERRTLYYQDGTFGTLFNRAADDVRGEILCQDGIDDYRVGNGVFLSLELEVRQYFRALQRLIGPADPFVARANAILYTLRKMSRDFDGFKDKEAFKAEVDSLNSDFEALQGLVLRQVGLPVETPGLRPIEDQRQEQRNQKSRRLLNQETMDRDRANSDDAKNDILTFYGGLDMSRLLSPRDAQRFEQDSQRFFRYYAKSLKERERTPNLTTKKLRQQVAVRLLMQTQSTLHEVLNFSVWASLMKFTQDFQEAPELPAELRKQKRMGIVNKE